MFEDRSPRGLGVAFERRKFCPVEGNHTTGGRTAGLPLLEWRRMRHRHPEQRIQIICSWHWESGLLMELMMALQNW